MIFKFIKFCLVGASGLILDFSVTYFFKEKIKIHRYLANGIGFGCAATTNYLLNRHWTFASTNPAVMREYGMFITFSLIGLGINSLFLYAFENRKYNFYVSKLFAICITTAWNFFANYFFNFSSSQ
jgi:putative flippase GtrA